MKKIVVVILCVQFQITFAQSWPSVSWSSAVNLTNILGSSAVTDFSGLHWNPINNRLYGVQDNGVVRVLQLDINTNSFSQIASRSISGGPEGITQANLYANEFYTVDETNYEIRRYTHSSTFSNISLYKHWNLLAFPSPMQDTGNTGPEGIVFIPDAILSSAGFISEQTGQLYTSVKGLGGLFFIASQDGGFIWVYDINPNSNDDFAYIGKYRTNRTESCDLSLDRSTGLLYILHNLSGNNKLEVTDLSTTSVDGNERKFIVKNEYFVSNPGDTNDNIEGFAITSKCSNPDTVSAWLCRDVKSSESTAIQQDVLRWFNPFVADGSCTPLATSEFSSSTIQIQPNPANDFIVVSSKKAAILTIEISNSLGQKVIKKENITNVSAQIDISKLQSGVYFIEVNHGEESKRTKFLKN